MTYGNQCCVQLNVDDHGIKMHGIAQLTFFCNCLLRNRGMYFIEDGVYRMLVAVQCKLACCKNDKQQSGELNMVLILLQNLQTALTVFCKAK